MIAPHPHEKFTMTAVLDKIIVYKFTKTTKVGFSVECFAADFWQISSLSVEICLLIIQLGTRLQFQASQAFLHLGAHTLLASIPSPLL